MERNFLGGNKFSSLCAWAGEPSQTLRKEKNFSGPKKFFFFLGGGGLDPYRAGKEGTNATHGNRTRGLW